MARLHPSAVAPNRSGSTNTGGACGPPADRRPTARRVKQPLRLASFRLHALPPLEGPCTWPWGLIGGQSMDSTHDTPPPPRAGAQGINGMLHFSHLGPGVFFHDGGRAHGRQRAWMAEGFWDWTDIARLVVTPGPTACRPTDGQRRGIAFHLLLAPGAFGKFWPATLLSRPPGATPTAASVLFPPGRPFPPHNRQGCAPATNRFANGDGTHRLPPGRPPNLERPSLPRHERGDVCGRERGRGRIGHLISDELAARVGCAGEVLRLNEDRRLPRVQPTRPDCTHPARLRNAPASRAGRRGSGRSCWRGRWASAEASRSGMTEGPTG